MRTGDFHHGPRLCLLTPKGRGAVAVLRLWGPNALATADAAFRPVQGRSLAATPTRRPRLGRVGAGLGDEVVAIAFHGESPEVEIQCHGGSAAVDLVVAALEAEGAAFVAPDEYVREAEPRPLRAQAWEDLALTTTLRTAEILLEQALGAFDRELDDLIALVQNEPEAMSALARLDELIARGEVGVRLARGWRVVLTGRPNVGKSRLLNALAGYARAIVSPTPGTTRDVLTVRTAFDGWPVELVDTAGVRNTEDSIERSGVTRALDERARADLTLLVVDGSAPWAPDERPTPDPRSILVVNKADLPAAWEPAATLAGVPFVRVSAETGIGLDALSETIARTLASPPPPQGAAVPFRSQQQDALKLARATLAAHNVEGALQILRDIARQ